MANHELLYPSTYIAKRIVLVVWVALYAAINGALITITRLLQDIKIKFHLLSSATYIRILSCIC